MVIVENGCKTEHQSSLTVDDDERLQEMMRYRKGATAVGCYFVSSISIVMVNKTLYNDPLPYPVMISLIQQIACITAGLLARCLNLHFGWKTRLFPSEPFLMSDFLLTGRTALFFVAYIILANTTLTYANVATYLVTRSLTLPGTYWTTVYWYQQSVSTTKTIGVLIVFIGYCVGSVQCNAIQMNGMYLGLMSSLAQIAYGFESKSVQARMTYKCNLLLFVSIWAAILHLPIFFLGDYKAAYQALNSLAVDGKLLLIVSCTAGMAITGSSFAIVDNFSTLAYEMTGYAKGALQSILGVLVMGDAMSLLWASSIILTILGSAAYSSEPQINSILKSFQKAPLVITMREVGGLELGHSTTRLSKVTR